MTHLYSQKSPRYLAVQGKNLVKESRVFAGANTVVFQEALRVFEQSGVAQMNAEGLFLYVVSGNCYIKIDASIN